LTFKAPKSLSALYAVTDDPRVQGAIVEAGDAAVRAALGWLEREAIHVRRGTGNQRFLADLGARDPEAAERAKLREVPARGMVAAVFRHRTSRAGDPLLHWHTLVANLAQGPDGRWSAISHPDLYGAVRAAGEVFQTVLRAEVTERLGLAWRPGRHVAEVAGVPQRLCDVFSKRSREIEAWLEATGTPGDARGRQEAVLATRQGKGEVEHERFDAVWKAEALTVGWGPDAAESLMASTGDRKRGRSARWCLPELACDGHDGVRFERVVGADEWIRTVVREELTAGDSTFTRADLTQVIAARLGDGATMATLEQVVARALASPELIPVAADRGARWTSRELLEVERRFVAAIDTSRGAREPVGTLRADEVVARLSSLGDDQSEAVRILAGSADGVAVLVGPAGTGKTFTLDTVRQIFEADGYRVIGAAPSARAALELQAGAGIESGTIHRLVGQWRRGIDVPTTGTLLVVDEAGMAGIRDLEAAVSMTVASGGRVILAGDQRQLPEVTAGGGFTAALDRCGTAAELEVNRRQQEPWEIEALANLRDGDLATAIVAYRDHQRVAVTPDRASMLHEAADMWLTARQAGEQPVLLSGTNELVDALNRTVRCHLHTQGQLEGPVLGRSGGRDLVAGDRVVLRRNSYTEHTTTGNVTTVLNGQTGTVVAGDHDHLDVRIDRTDNTVRLRRDYLDRGFVDHGYALTTHRAQGGTWDLAIAVGTDGLYREAAYVQMSRGARSNVLVVTEPEMAAVDAEVQRHDHGIPLPAEEPDDIDTDLRRHLERSRSKLLAIAHDPDAATVDTLARTVSLDHLEARARYARSIEHQATTVVGIDPRRSRAAAVRAQHTATHIAIGQQVKAHDRHNIGIVSHLDDNTGTATVCFTSARGHQARRDLPWDQIEIVTPRNPEPRTMTPQITRRLDAVAESATADLEAWQSHLDRHGVTPGDGARCERAAALQVDRAAANLAASTPHWLTQR
ncbi:MAG: hypothetical protein JWM47_731, partial [Acidimicrobiales bacterium]|nr:hypothetical protein [Acidimicrobiales bacterium]